MNRFLVFLLILFGAAGFTALNIFFTVQESEQAIILQFGEPKEVIYDAGLHKKLPFIQNVAYYEKRVIGYDHPDEEVIAKDKKRLVLDTYMRYRITDPLEFRRTVRDEGNVRRRLSSTVSSALRNVVGGLNMEDLLSSQRASAMASIQERVASEVRAFGIDIIDVRIRRADLPAANSQAIFERMKSERLREAKEFRAQGEEAAQRIRSKAERERTVILAEARRDAEKLRGIGDGTAIRLYVQAFNKDTEFFSFYRSMQAYERALQGDSTTMVLSPDSQFFKHFAIKQPSRGQRK
ncbi:MAG: protease modulator HflC [Alphaproteobacteria bacterium GM202ARS2]|nr:protease modulator HflC [Alphaproteobacteria bacterium GM202ARS2]